MSWTTHKGKKRRLIAVTQDVDTGEILKDLAPALRAPRQQKGAFVDYVKYNAQAARELRSLSGSARLVFHTMASTCELGNTLHASQAAIADESGCTQPTVSKALRELIAADFVRIETNLGRTFYRLSPYIVWRGANLDHRPAQAAWDKTKNNVIALSA